MKALERAAHVAKHWVRRVQPAPRLRFPARFRSQRPSPYSFPVELENPLSVVTYALAVAAVSGMEVVLFRHAQRRRLFARQPPEDVYRWGVRLSLSPVLTFLISIPLAFVNTSVAVASWFLAVPYQALANRKKPENADDYL